MIDEIITLLCAIVLFVMAAKELRAIKCRTYDLVAITMASITATVIIIEMAS